MRRARLCWTRWTNALLVANDKGIGTTGFQNTPPENSTVTAHGSPAGLNTHQDLGVVSIVPVPNRSTLDLMTEASLPEQPLGPDALNIFVGRRRLGKGVPKPVAIPERVGDPSTIKHVFVIIREKPYLRSDALGDVAVLPVGQANLAVFGSTGIYGNVTPNAHALIERFPLFDNFYDPSRQSADGHNWILQAMAPYSDGHPSRRTGTATIPPTLAMRLLISPRATCTIWRPGPASR